MTSEFLQWLETEMATTMEDKTDSPHTEERLNHLDTKWQTLFLVKEKIKDAMYKEAMK